MVVQVFPACPLFTKDEQPHFENICMEFIPGASRFCPDKGNNSFNLKSEILAMFRVHTTSCCDKYHG